MTALSILEQLFKDGWVTNEKYEIIKKALTSFEILQANALTLAQDNIRLMNANMKLSNEIQKLKEERK